MSDGMKKWIIEWKTKEWKNEWPIKERLNEGLDQRVGKRTDTKVDKSLYYKHIMIVSWWLS